MCDWVVCFDVPTCVIAILEYILGLFTQKLGLQKERPMNTYYAAIVNHPNQKLDPDNNTTTFP